MPLSSTSTLIRAFLVLSWGRVYLFAGIKYPTAGRGEIHYGWRSKRIKPMAANVGEKIWTIGGSSEGESELVDKQMKPI